MPEALAARAGEANRWALRKLVMETSLFEIEILEQGWLGSEQTEYDLCSHGKIRLVIGGYVISSGEEEYGISESALALLRTLASNHSRMYPVAERLVFHGCGTLLMMGCPIGINWNVTHTPDGVRLDNIVRYDTTNEEQGVKFNGLQVLLTEEDHRRRVVAFALQAKQFFQESPRSYYDDFDQQQSEAFWAEYETLLEKYRAR
jgi:hypothetical protein